MLKHLNALSEPAQSVFDHLIDRLDKSGCRKFGDASSLIMAVCARRIAERHYSIAQYYEQNGELKKVPEMTFFKCPAGRVYACTFQQSNLARYRVGLEISTEGVILARNLHEQADQTGFANLWMKHIAEQQCLPFRFPEDADD